MNLTREWSAGCLFHHLRDALSVAGPVGRHRLVPIAKSQDATASLHRLALLLSCMNREAHWGHTYARASLPIAFLTGVDASSLKPCAHSQVNGVQRKRHSNKGAQKSTHTQKCYEVHRVRTRERPVPDHLQSSVLTSPLASRSTGAIAGEGSWRCRWREREHYGRGGGSARYYSWCGRWR